MSQSLPTRRHECESYFSHPLPSVFIVAIDPAYAERERDTSLVLSIFKVFTKWRKQKRIFAHFIRKKLHWSVNQPAVNVCTATNKLMMQESVQTRGLAFVFITYSAKALNSPEELFIS